MTDAIAPGVDTTHAAQAAQAAQTAQANQTAHQRSLQRISPQLALTPADTHSDGVGASLSGNAEETPAAKENEFKAFGDDGFTFSDFIDIINPLQHIPVLASIYRKLTGDEIDPASRVAGGTLFGGPVGAAIAVANVSIEESTGKDMGEHAMAFFTGEGPDSAGGPVLANGQPAVSDAVAFAAAEADAAAEATLEASTGTAGIAAHIDVMHWAKREAEHTARLQQNEPALAAVQPSSPRALASSNAPSPIELANAPSVVESTNAPSAVISTNAPSAEISTNPSAAVEFANTPSVERLAAASATVESAALSAAVAATPATATPSLVQTAAVEIGPLAHAVAHTAPHTPASRPTASAQAAAEPAMKTDTGAPWFDSAIASALDKYDVRLMALTSQRGSTLDLHQ